MSRSRVALSRYEKKRDFHATPEPEARIRKSGKDLTYVVQRHDARRLHYDFRLELDGVLKSWAVPKGPSLVLGEKRLAVEVEDHPLDYGHFEGAIPEGHYGAGHVQIWDEGTWKPDGDPHVGLRQGKLSFQLTGKRLNGGFALVRLRRSEQKPQWLLIKERDAFVAEKGSKSVTAEVAPPELAKFEPELATLSDDMPIGKDWIVEPKLDGYRALARVERGSAELMSRNGKAWTDRFGGVVKALEGLPIASAVFDGEICALDEAGMPRFQLLQNSRAGNVRGKASKDAADARLVYFVFDLLFLDGEDLRGHPLSTRKSMLESVLGKAKAPLAYVSHVASVDGPALLKAACAKAAEGVVVKRLAAPYVGRRTTDWVKVKCGRRQEVVVVGFTAPSGARQAFGALLLAVNENGKLRYVGKVGTGFDTRALQDLARRMKPLIVKTPAVTLVPKMKAVTWIEPALVAEVSFAEWTGDGAMRHPSFIGLREDKAAKDVQEEKPVHPKKSATKRTAETELGGVRISHPDRVIDETTGVTKLELAEYYLAVSERVLPYIEGRPLALVRCPEGDRAKCFFQKQRTPGMSDSIHRGRVGKNSVLYVDDVQGLLSLVQFGAVELHVWGSRLANVHQPDWLVMDLDPAPELDFERTLDAADAVRELLRTLGLESFPKTTGGKGIHVVAPIVPRFDFDDVKELTRSLAERLARDEPTLYTSVMSKKGRTGKVFVDYLRNGEGATAVAPYSVRARPGCPVALPISWAELRKIKPSDFTVRTVPDILKRRKKDPWASFLSVEQKVPDALRERPRPRKAS